MNVSVIISTWNNAKRLAITLETLASCSIPQGLQWEIILVNNRCTDDTDHVVAGYLKHLPLIYVYEPTQGLSIAKNKGLQTAKGQLVIFTDDDVRVCPEWIETYLKSFLEHPNKTFFGGPVESEYESQPNRELIRFAPYSVKGFNLGEKEKFLEDKTFISANWACEREALINQGGFDTKRGLSGRSNKLVTGEEVHLMNKLRHDGFQALYLPHAKIKHFVPTSKCTLKHIAARVEAFSVQKITSSCKEHKKEVLNKIPMIASTLTKSLVRLGVDKIQGKKDSIGYVQFRRSIGYIRGVKESLLTH
jgi:glycosyltransferase involved in cell wall biosynthesis